MAALPDGRVWTPIDMNVVLIVLTFQRPAGLPRALDAIGGLETPSDGSISLDVAVIDNDMAGSARAGEAAAADFPIPLDHVIEALGGFPRPGTGWSPSRRNVVLI